MPNSHTIGSTLITRLLESYYFQELGVKILAILYSFMDQMCGGRKGQELQLPFFLQIICVTIMCTEKTQSIDSSISNGHKLIWWINSFAFFFLMFIRLSSVGRDPGVPFRM
jgi:hypothetical protein